MRALHYSYRTEQVYLHWIRFFIRYHNKRHPREMGQHEVEGFLTFLATKRHVSASTQNQALSALLFLYQKVLGMDTGWIDGVVRVRKEFTPESTLSDCTAGSLFRQLPEIIGRGERI
jgi:hypothetical protein